MSRSLDLIRLTSICALAAVPTIAQAQGGSIHRRNSAPPPEASIPPGIVPPGAATNTPHQAAQPAPASNNAGIADIVVTAERRSQSTQKAPLTIQVVNAQDIANRGLSTAIDLTKLTSGVEIGAAGSNTQIYVRGVGSYAATPLSSPGVAFNVDGVYVGRPAAINGNFYDIARIEVLKGPQGTLYGRNANGGSISLLTNEPMLGERSLDLNMEAGNYAAIHTTGAINLPVGDDLAIRAAFNVVQRNGYLSDGTFDDIQQGGRLRLKWRPSAKVTLLLSADAEHVGGKGSDAVFLPQRPGSDPYESITAPAEQAYKHGFPTSVFAPFTNTDRPDAFQDNRFYNVSAQLDVDLGFAKLTILPAYRRAETKFLTDDIAVRQYLDSSGNQYSIESRLGGTTGPLTWVAGFYYFRETQSGYYDITAGDVPVPFLGGQVLINQKVTLSPRTSAYAPFGQATYEVLNGFRLIGGIRYTHEVGTDDGSISNLTPARLVTTFPGRAAFNGVTYRVGAEYDLTPRNLLYATYNTGFKAGGLNQTSTPSLQKYEPEKLNAIEIGSKNRFLDNHLQINLSGFYWKYRHLQDTRTTFDAFSVNYITFNSGNATLYGASLDIVVKPTRHDTISFTGEYDHARYDSFAIREPTALYLPGSVGCPTHMDGSDTVADCSGYQVARVPRFTGSATADHIFPLANGGDFDLQGSVKFSSSRSIGIDFIAPERSPSYAVVDSSFTYDMPHSRFQLGLFVRNLTNKVYYTGGAALAFIPGLFAANIAAPRTYGVRIGGHF